MKSFLTVVGTALLLSASAMADNMEFQSCATGPTPVVTLDSVDWTPLPARRKTTHATFVGSTSAPILGGTFTVDATAYGWNLPTISGDICDPKAIVHIDCPLEQTDHIVLETDFKVPFLVPNGEFKITMAGKDLDGNELFCTITKFQLGGKQAGAVLDASEETYLRGEAVEA